jgi:hypothetical protein
MRLLSRMIGGEALHGIPVECALGSESPSRRACIVERPLQLLGTPERHLGFEEEIAVAVNDNLGPWTWNMALTFGPCKPSETRGGVRGSKLTPCGPLSPEKQHGCPNNLDQLGVNDHRLTAGGFGLRLEAGLIGPSADSAAQASFDLQALARRLERWARGGPKGQSKNAA